MKLSKFLSGAAVLAFAAGMASTSSAAPSAVFNLTGSVTSSCVVSFPSSSVSFGTITVFNDPTSVSTLFHMNSAGGNGELGSGGCNTNNSSTISKVGGTLHNTTTASYNANTFTPDLQYTAGISWTGPFAYAAGPQANGNPCTCTDATHSSFTQTAGAFASNMTLWINVPVAPLALLSGTYADTVDFTIAPTL
jgi:hypothetical protein